jgi:GntR family transcriptional repressor for pyruvate dehydrogenase complex
MIRGKESDGVAWERPKRQKLSEQIAEQILGQIASGTYPPGEKLPSEEELRRQLGVGRASLREAMLRLAGMGVVDLRHGSGAYVVEHIASAGLSRLDWSLMLESRQVLSLIEARKLLEVQIAALAAERATDDDLAAMRACLVRLRASPTRAEYIRADLEFHLAIARGTHNDVLARLLHTIRDLTERTVWQSPTPKAEGVVQHEGIFAAIAARDPSAAREAMYAHLDEVESRARQLAAPPGPPATVPATAVRRTRSLSR